MNRSQSPNITEGSPLILVLWTLVLALLVVGGAAGVAAVDGTVGVAIGEAAGAEVDATTESGLLGDDAIGADPTVRTTDPNHGVSTAGSTRSAVFHPDPIRLHDELFLIDEPGYVGVRATVEVPETVPALRITLHDASGDPIDVNGFERVEDAEQGEGTFEWDGETDRPSVTYRMAADHAADGEGPLDGGGSYRFVDAGDWALVGTPVSDLHYSSGGGEVAVVRERGVEGEGVASQAMAFLGPHEEYVHEAAGQRFRLVVPEAADPVASPEEVFDAFEYAATALQVGARDTEVVAIVAPTDEVDWAARGVQAGDRDLWVAADEPVGTADDVWTHEYVHTRQGYDTAGETSTDEIPADGSARWFTEATATYYAALFAVDRGKADFDEFQRILVRGERQPAATAILDDPTTWRGTPDYTKGALVAGEVDRQLRVATDGRASLATVFRELNAASEPVTNRDFLDAVEAAAAEHADASTAAAIRDDAERYTTTDAVPTVWDRGTHAEAFGAPPAQVGYEVAEDGVRATGEYRDRPTEHDPVRLVAGETLALEVSVRNTGGEPGAYDVELRVDGEVVAAEDGTIEPDTERTVELTHTFETPGEHEVTVGDETVSVVVAEPASVTVDDLSVEPGTIEVDDEVVATVSVRNDADLPAGGEIQLLVDGEAVATDTVRLDVDGSTTLEHEITLESPGTIQVEAVGPADAATATVTVEGDGPLGGVADDLVETVDEVPGFGPVAAIVAVIAFLSTAALARRKR
ncbi:hypothetical protein [Halorubrum vacuolatum]|uniref:CARDB protein n=1 Tax=Halorubrum vacuolatum TaxID=63740 RepID=A0A238VAT8_HALVU|nr:hypothetical protein [Halorubrum vacuolatum]SNR30659.1 hypothetical protein SAMN06264855_10289 [Halorubrum vacuolatum]